MNQQRRWAARLEGPDWMLEEMAPHVTGRSGVRRGPDGWKLTDEQFESAETPAAVDELATERVTLLRAVAGIRFGTREALDYRGLAELQADGSRKRYIFAKGGIAIGVVRVHAVGIVSGDPAAKPPAPESWEPFLELAERDLDVYAALALLNPTASWHSLYAALDPVRRDVGGDAGIEKRGWATKALVDQFKWTANSYQAAGTAASTASATRAPSRTAGEFPDPPRPRTLATAAASGGG